MTHPYITYLQMFAESEERGPLAALRRGLGQPPGAVAEMYRYVVPWLPDTPTGTQEAAYYLVASLFAYHPKSTTKGNMGTHLSHAREAASEDALERRFTALLAAHPEDLPVYLRQAVSYLNSKDVPVNWDELFRDLQQWHYQDQRVQKRWAREFWRRSRAITPSSE